MLNSLFSDKVDFSANVLQLLEGHQNFLNANTGTTNDAEQDHYVFNPQLVLSNNRHFIAKSQQEAQPNGDATTEGQSLQIIGYCYAYMATRDQKWLDLARKTFDAYIDFFYAGKPIPSTPQAYISNWLVNGKEPVLSNWPVNFEEPTHSGFKGELLNYSGGQTIIPHGAPYYGEYLDKATFAFVGELGWDAVNASVQAIDSEGNIDWANDGIQYDVDWIINWEGKKINWDGDVLSQGHTEAEKGSIKLKDTSVNGSFKTNWANRQPVEFGGFMLERNKPWHNRPLNVPVQLDYLGNAADAEEWFADAAYLLWKITGEQKHYLVWQCVLETCKDYSNIDLYDRFFRASTRDQTPFTDGISYDYSYPSGTNTTYGRTPEGYITFTKSEASQHTIEQQSVWFRIDKNSKLRVQYSGVDNTGAPLQARAVLSISSQKTGSPTDLKPWVAALPASSSTAMQTYDIPLYALVAQTDASGNAYMMADSRSTFDYGTGVTSTIEYATGILNARQGNVGHARFTNSDSGYGIGFYLTPSGRGQLKSISYRADSNFHLNIVDKDGWRFHWNLTATGTSYRTADLPVANAIPNSYQVNNGTPPSVPSFYDIDEFTITPADDGVTNANFYWYAVNTLPATFSGTDGYTIKFNLTISGQTGFTAYVGDCTILDYKANNLAYTPGTIPFSNISVPETVQFDGWRGMPYPGYQYPFIYCHNRTPGEFDERLNNMTNFLFDSQQWYSGYLGQLGPVAGAYIWNRWDNLKYGKADTWTMYHWGDDSAWSGYQPRAFFGAARAWYELVIEGRTPPPKLVQYTENWLRWLINYVKTYKITPTDFPTNNVPQPLEDDFTGHMCGLWLAGACMAALAGCTVTGLDDFIEAAVIELQENFVITGTPDMIMDGAWSPAIRANTGTGPENNGMFFGFWSGEILRGLGLYLLYKEIAPKTNMYTNLKQ